MPPLLRNNAGQVRNGWKIAGFVVLAAALVALMAAVNHALTSAARVRALPDAWFAWAGVLLASAICAWLERATMASLSLKPDARTGARAGLGLLFGASLLLATAGIVVALDGMHLVRAHPVSIAAVLGAGVTTLGVALAEETFFRAYLLQRAIRGLGPHAAIAVVALGFMLAHQVDPDMSELQRAVSSANIFMAGVLLGLCYLRTRSLAVPVGVHLGWNWALDSLGFPIDVTRPADAFFVPVMHHRPEWLTGGVYGLEASVASLAVLAAAILWLALRPPAVLQSRA